MAEALITPLVLDLLSYLGSAAFRKIALVYGVEEELAKLKDTFSAMQSVLLDAEQKADLSHAVKDWLGKLKDAAYDADDMLDELSYETLRREVISRDKIAKKVRIFFSKHNQLVFGAKVAVKIKKLRQRLEHIAADRAQFHFSETAPDQSRTKEREYTHSFVPEEEVIGRDVEKEEVVQLLLKTNEKHNVSANAIVGMGGLGKTMLAQSLFNDKRVEGAFGLRLWVCISEIFDLKIIVEKIIESATKERPSGLEMDSLQSRLRSQIDGKKYLLVLDDVWNDNDERWASLKRLLMGGAKGSKILITTRSEKVAHVCQATSPYIVEGLSETNSWILFKKLAFKESEERESPNMIEIGKEIVKKCKGVPLVIRIIGRLLYFKTSEAKWLSFKNNELTTITQQENDITQVLKLSYNHLPSHLKSCFAYCSLFPKDHKFKKDELIKLWVADGLVQSQDGNKCSEDVGNEYFMELIWRSIFQDVERNEEGEPTRCKLHDLMHDLTRLVAGAECFAPDSDIKDVNERTRRVLFDRGSKWSIHSIPQLKPYKLRTFLTSSLSLFYESNETGLEEHISSFKSLRILDLSFLDREVPFSIGILKHLRLLNLSRNRKIESLPSSITKLHNLQTLNLNCCERLKELPKGIGSLINLRDLDISCNDNIKLLPKSITKLQFLQKLDLKYCSLLGELPEDIGNLVNLRHLDLSENGVIKLLPNSIIKLQFLHTLILCKCKSLIELPKNIGNMVDLRFLDLSLTLCMILLPNSIAKLQKLQSLKLWYCSSLRELPRDLCNLVNLKHLDLEYCNQLREMPLGLDKLTALQTMNLYVVSPSMSSEDGGLCQLNTLVNIMGKLCIRGLHHLRKDSSQVNSVNLKDNHRFGEFSLEWDELGYNPSAFDPDFMVLEKLHPNKNVETLSICGYGGVRLCRWVSSLLNLTEISIMKCERLQDLPPFDRFPNLQKLCLEELSLIEYVDNNEAVDEFDSVCFPSLQSLTLGNMDILKGWWKPREFTPKDAYQSFLLPSFLCLSSLSIRGCSQLISILSHAEDGTRWEALDGLCALRLDGLPKLASLPEYLRHSTTLLSLSITDCNNLLALPDWIGNLTSLQELEIINCPKVTSLPEGIHRLSSLRYLVILRCSRLEQRCMPQAGDDWFKVAHVKDVYIGKEQWVKMEDERGREKWKKVWPK